MISAFKLQNGHNSVASSDQSRRHATVIILIISGFFCAVNMAYVFSLFTAHFVWQPKNPNENTKILLTILFSKFVGIPFNSTINPIIYFTRKKEMRDYITSTLNGCCRYHCCCCYSCSKSRSKHETGSTLKSTQTSALSE